MRNLEIKEWRERIVAAVSAGPCCAGACPVLECITIRFTGDDAEAITFMPSEGVVVWTAADPLPPGAVASFKTVQMKDQSCPDTPADLWKCLTGLLPDRLIWDRTIGYLKNNILLISKVCSLEQGSELHFKAAFVSTLGDP